MSLSSKDRFKPAFCVLLIAFLTKTAIYAMGLLTKGAPLIFTLALSDFLLVVPFALYYGYMGEKRNACGAFKSAVNLVALTGLTYFMLTYANLLLGFFGVQSGRNDLFSGNAVRNTVVAAHAVIIAPVLEEFVFRKVVYLAAEPMGRIAAIVFSALLFALFHPSGLVYSLFFGLLLAYVASGRRILSAIVIHAAVNLFSCIPPLMKTVLGKTAYDVFLHIYFASVFVFGIICAGVLAVGFLRSKNEQKS